VQGEFAITAVKLAESGAGLVLRGYETAGRPGQVRLRLPGWASRAALADLRERETGELPMQQGQVAFPVNPHEIVTLILRA
jgi:alpha-mannosidase